MRKAGRRRPRATRSPRTARQASVVSPPMFLSASNTFWPSSRTPMTTTNDIEVALRSIPPRPSRTCRDARATALSPGPSSTFAYERRWPIAMRQQVSLEVLLYTGLRRGDAVHFGRQHVRDGVGSLKTEKSSFTVTVTLPILPVLAETLAAGPRGDLTFIAGERGQPLTKESFGNLFRDACRPAVVRQGCRAHAAQRSFRWPRRIPSRRYRAEPQDPGATCRSRRLPSNQRSV